MFSDPVTVYLLVATLVSASLFVLGLMNALVFRAVPRADAPEDAGRVSVCIPARNEEQVLAACLESLLGQTVTNFEILVLDDNSTDATAAVAARIAARDARVRVLAGTPRPAGWAGKPWACHQLALAAEGRWLLFVDADTRHHPTMIASLLRQAGRTDCAFLSAVPRQITLSFWERVAVPLMLYIYYTFIPAWMITRSPRPAFTAANGQTLLLRTDAYHDSGGHDAVRSMVVEDVGLGRAFKRRGHRIALVNGSLLSTCHMYADRAGVLAGFGKNLYPGLGFSTAGIIGLTLFVCGALSAWLPGLLFTLPTGITTVQGVLMLALLLMPITIRIVINLQFRMPVRDALLQPLSLLFLIALAWHSRHIYESGAGAEWKGRIYHRESGR